ncbi:MAG TPA: hypothetical protein VHT24_07540 [Pseudacidobacterium sp.]|jgi:hypothetical protein|nr:hypothetical protein [Pseudacidobacterium sp.]
MSSCSFSRQLHLCCIAILIAGFAGIPVFSQAGIQNGPTSWAAMPYLKPSQLRSLITNSELVAKATVLQHWPREIDPQTHIEKPAHTSLRIDKVFRGKLQPEETLDLICICSSETGSTVLTQGEEIITFANFNQKAGAWVPSSFAYSIYFLDYSEWLDHQISERVPRH